MGCCTPPFLVTFRRSLISTTTRLCISYNSNPGGIRFGSAEIYDVLDMCFAQGLGVPPEHVVSDCVAVGQSLRGGVDERVVLFVKLLDGHVLGPELEKKIKSEIRARRTARHVPERVSGRSTRRSALRVFPSIFLRRDKVWLIRLPYLSGILSVRNLFWRSVRRL